MNEIFDFDMYLFSHYWWDIEELIDRKKKRRREENTRLERSSFERRRLEQKKAIEREGEGNIQYMINALLLLLYY